ncbi:MAG TPA: TM2 domain-containing protein [Candidatus Corynebacterium gallistercoris]|uniref:TM2 domain-containing protein n=1 Tax=Candidatus Corynebacterium gallistercoris TaxID=2838530 RepID=A0A9D1RZG1_9CORY|nr:TM2 domain-containing protein [Candidatus Corynebacterium gallistercoris]
MTNPQDSHYQPPRDEQYPGAPYGQAPGGQVYAQAHGGQSYGRTQGYGQQQYGAQYAATGYTGQPIGEPKNKIIAAVLAFFLGTLGVHNFYLGYDKRGAWQLGLTIVGYVTTLLLFGFAIVIGVAIWAFVEFVMILVGSGTFARDARGIPLSN